MRVILGLLLLVGIMVFAGWLSFDNDGDSATATFNQQEAVKDTEEVINDGKRLLDQTEQAIEETAAEVEAEAEEVDEPDPEVDPEVDVDIDTEPKETIEAPEPK